MRWWLELVWRVLILAAMLAALWVLISVESGRR